MVTGRDIEAMHASTLLDVLARVAIRPSGVAWIEVFRGAVGGWEVGAGGSGGLIRIQTKRGRPMEPPSLDPELCDIPGWRRGSAGRTEGGRAG
ncbi:MAG: hypothetical protein AMXMBFR53_28300 [Gemmatimonadota bacterium]